MSQQIYSYLLAHSCRFNKLLPSIPSFHVSIFSVEGVCFHLCGPDTTLLQKKEFVVCWETRQMEHNGMNLPLCSCWCMISFYTYHHEHVMHRCTPRCFYPKTPSMWISINADFRFNGINMRVLLQSHIKGTGGNRKGKMEHCEKGECIISQWKALFTIYCHICWVRVIIVRLPT